MARQGHLFVGAKTKLEESRVILDQLRAATDAPTFRTSFNAFLTASQAITYALQKDGKYIPGFDNWYETKRDEMRKDELLRFIHNARTEDFHEGKHKLVFETYVEQFPAGPLEPPPCDDAKICIGPEGIFWLVDEGTPHERRIPVKTGRYSVQVFVQNAPTLHRGRTLARNDAITICQLALDYFSDLVYEAGEKFGSEGKHR